MRKLNTERKIILTLGIIGVLTGIYGRYNAWAYDDYFVFFYTGMSLVWVAFLTSSKSCSRPFWKKQTQNQ